jgi:hypothetical protein
MSLFMGGFFKQMRETQVAEDFDEAQDHQGER